MENAAELVVSAYVQVGASVWIGDGCGRRAQWGCLTLGLVGAMGVVELLVLAQGVAQVVLVPDESAVQELVTATLYQRSMTEFILGTRTPVRTVWMPASVRISPMGGGELRVAVADRELHCGTAAR